MCRESGEGEVENGQAANTKAAAVDGGVATDVDHHLARVECPLGLGQFAGSHGAVGNNEVIGSGLLDKLPCESEGTGRSQDRRAAFHANADCADNIVKLPALAADVVTPVAGLDV